MRRPISLLVLLLLLCGCAAERLKLNGRQLDGTVEDIFPLSAAAVADAVERSCAKDVAIGFVRGRIDGTNYELSAVGRMRGHFSAERRTEVYSAMTSQLIAELNQRGYRTIAEDADAIRTAQVDGINYGRKGVELAQEDVAGVMIRLDLSAEAFNVDGGRVAVLEGPSFRFSVVDVKSKAVLARVNME